MAPAQKGAADTAGHRAVGNMERYSVSRHNALTYIGIASYLTFSAPGGVFDRAALEPVLEKAIQATALRHGNLRMALPDPRAPKPVFSRWSETSSHSGKTVPTPRFVEAGDVLRVLEAELKTPFPVESGPLWRVTVVGVPGQSLFHLVVAVHHATADGKSSMVILQSLARALAGASDAGEQFDSQPVEKICKGVYVPLKVLLWEVFENLLLPSFLRPLVAPKDYFAGSRQLPADSPTFSTEPRTPETIVATNLDILELSQSELASLLAACKRNGTTLQGALMAAVGQAIATKLAQKPTKIRIGSPVCLRSDSGVPENEVAVCVSSTDFDTRIKPDHPSSQTFWKLANDARQSVIKGKAGPARHTLALLGYVGDDFDGFILKAGMGTPNRKSATCEVSNAMSWNNLPQAKIGASTWTVESGGFSQCASPFGCMIYFSVVSVEGKLTMIGSIRDDGLVERSELREVLDEVKSLLLEMSA